MSDTVAHGPIVAWGAATRTLPGEEESGDRHIVAHVSDGVLIAGVDGLGHGEEAMIAATRAAVTLERHAAEPLLMLARRCHEALIGTRGVVMTLGKILPAEDTLTWLAIGNVAGLLVRADRDAEPEREAVVLRGGVVGYQLPPLSATVLPIVPGDLVILATDGVREDFADGVVRHEDPERMAKRLLRQFGKDNDDALVLVARYLGDR